MDNAVRISQDFTVAKFEPGKNDFRRIAAEGFRSIVSFQTLDEEQNLKPEEERRLAEEAGLAFLHHPVSSDSLSDEVVDRFREELEKLPKPSFLHCASGKRSGALVMMHIASEEGMSGEEVIERAESMGFECDTPELESFVKNYVQQHGRK